MIQLKCDLCKKIIKDRDKAVSVGSSGIFYRKEFCQKCAKPIINFLKKNKLFKKD